MELIRALMDNKSDIQPRIIHGDTQAQTASAFGLCHLFGIDLRPRIRNWQGLRLLKPDADARYAHIDKLFSPTTVDWDLIETHLPDMLRTVLSVRMGRLSPDLLRRLLTTFGARNRLNQAFSELGRVIRTGYLLNWLSNRELRESVHRGTNKSETTHAFRDFLAFGGEVLRQFDRVEQQKATKYAQLVANLVVLYNVVHMTQILNELVSEGFNFADEDLTFLSPYGTRHMDLDALHGGFLKHHRPPESDQVQ